MKLFEGAKEYIKQMTIADLAMLKLCLFSIGMIVALLLPPTAKEMALIIAIAVFIITYVPLMTKYFKITTKK
jgi:hypothetical protein